MTIRCIRWQYSFFSNGNQLFHLNGIVMTKQYNNVFFLFFICSRNSSKCKWCKLLCMMCVSRKPQAQRIVMPILKTLFNALDVNSRKSLKNDADRTREWKQQTKKKKNKRIQCVRSVMPAASLSTTTINIKAFMRAYTYLDKPGIWYRMTNKIIVLFTLYYGHSIAELSKIIIRRRKWKRLISLI